VQSTCSFNVNVCVVLKHDEQSVSSSMSMWRVAGISSHTTSSPPQQHAALVASPVTPAIVRIRSFPYHKYSDMITLPMLLVRCWHCWFRSRCTCIRFRLASPLPRRIRRTLPHSRSAPRTRCIARRSRGFAGNVRNLGLSFRSVCSFLGPRFLSGFTGLVIRSGAIWSPRRWRK